MIVVILCAPRSGSSAVAQFFHEMGCRMYLVHDDEDADIWGYERYEDAEMTAFGNKMSEVWGSMALLTKYVDKPVEIPKVSPIEEAEFRALISARMKDQVLWGWKDPNTIWYIDQLHNVLEEYDSVSYVWVKRDKRKAAQSMMCMHEQITGSPQGKLRDYIRLYEIYQDSISGFLKEVGRPAFHVFYEGNYGKELRREIKREDLKTETGGIDSIIKGGFASIYTDG